MMDFYLRVLHWSLDVSGARALRARLLAEKGHLSWRDHLRARMRDHRIWMIGVALGCFALTIVLFMAMPTVMFPDENSDFTQIRIEMVPGTTLAQTEAVADQVAGIVRQRPEVDQVLERVNEGTARVMIMLKKDRKIHTKQFEREVTPPCRVLPTRASHSRPATMAVHPPGAGWKSCCPARTRNCWTGRRLNWSSR
jgi:multidrug efflux pump subunit AcrB